MPPRPSMVEVKLALARALGLSTDGLTGFTLTVRADEPLPIVEGRYHVRTADGLVEVVRKHGLAPRSEG